LFQLFQPIGGVLARRESTIDSLAEAQILKANVQVKRLRAKVKLHL